MCRKKRQRQQQQQHGMTLNETLEFFNFYPIETNHFFLCLFLYLENYCREHRCANQYCVSRDLVCDGVNHCGDNSDEHYYVHCQGNQIQQHDKHDDILCYFCRF